METATGIARQVRRVCVASSFLLVAACAGNGQGLDANGRPLLPGGGGSPPPLAATFDSIQANIFTPICSLCHVSAGAPEGLRLDAANSYNLLVGVPSTEVPTVLRVKPGDPDNSYIIQKLEGHAAVGSQMPFGCPASQPCLTSSTIAFIRQWITDGAAPSAAVALAAAAPFAITSVVPNDSEAISCSPPQIMIAFNHELDLTQIVSGSAHVDRLASDAAGPALEIVPALLTVPAANSRALLVWPSRALAAGHYRVVLDGSPEFHDIAGQSVSTGMRNDLGESVISTFEVVR